MYNTIDVNRPRDDGPVFLIRHTPYWGFDYGSGYSDRSRTEFRSLKAALKSVNYRNLRIDDLGNVRVRMYHPKDHDFGDRIEFIDRCGDRIDGAVVLAAAVELIEERPRGRLYREWLNDYAEGTEAYRRVPVPLTGNRRRYWRYFKRFRHFQERKEASFCEVDDEALEFGVRARAKRNARNLPNPWDDYVRHRSTHTSWKKSRRHQWKS